MGILEYLEALIHCLNTVEKICNLLSPPTKADVRILIYCDSYWERISIIQVGILNITHMRLCGIENFESNFYKHIKYVYL